MPLKRIRLWLRAFFNRAGAEADLNDELRFHVEQQTNHFVSQGLPYDEARRRALVALGGIEATKETYRDGRGTRTLEEFVDDVRYAVRTLWHDRALAVAGALTLALGIGATTAVFSAVNAVMLRELPFRDSDRLVSVWEENPDRGWYKNVVAPANYLDWRTRVDAFESAAGYFDYPQTVTLLGQGEPLLLNATYVTGNFLSVLHVRPHLGRGFDPGDDWDDGQRPVILSYKAWKERFRGDSAVIGASFTTASPKPWQIVGVMPEGFAFPLPNTDVFFPMLWDRNNPTRVFFRRAHFMRVVARLKPGISTDAANASLQTVVRQLQTEYPQTNTRMGAGITPLREWIVGDTKRPLVVLLSAAAVLLLIACANVGNLLLVHALSRARSVSLRLALGATRERVARQALTESLVLSFAGGLAGLALGWIGARALLAMQPSGMLPVTDIGLDYRVLAFTTALVAASGILFGVTPAMIATRQAPAEALNASGRGFTGGRVRKWGKHLVVAEIALAVTLTVGAGLLLRSYERLTRVDPGFEPRGVLTATFTIPGTRYDSAAKIVSFYHTLIERVQALPGVERAAASRQLPVTVSSWTANLAVKGRPIMEQSSDIIYRETMGDYFRVMRVPLLEGRPITGADNATAVPVAVINDAMATQYFANGDPVGQQIATDRVPDSTTTWYTVVGVVGAEHQGSLAVPARPEVYLSMPQSPTRQMSLVVRAKDGRNPMTLAKPVRAAVRELDSLLAITSVRPMTEVYSEAMSRQRFTSVLVLVFALTGVVLALVGVFGVLAQLVQSRWREMGIRLALGAQQSQVRWLVARQGATLLVAGVVGGLAIAYAATRVLATLLFEIQPTDLVTYVGVALTIGGVGMLAALVPAWRASTANPATSLRAE